MTQKVKTAIANFAYSPIVSWILSKTGGVTLWTKIQVRSRLKKMLSEAYREYENGSQLGSFDDYRQACKKHWVTYREYAYQYEFYKKSEVERNEYVSRLRMASFYWKYTPASVKYVFREKRRFLRKFNGYIHRKWLYVPEASFEEFEQLLCSHDCIVKPCDGKLGQGISKVYKDGDHTNDRLLYETCVKDRMLLEQCI